MTKQRQPMSRKKKIWLALFALVVVSLVSLHFGSKWQVLRIADRFQPDSSWELTNEFIQPFRFICVDNSAQCPSMYRVWDTGRLVTRDELERRIISAGLPLHFNGDCTRESSVSGSTSLCRASGDMDGMHVTISVSTIDYLEEGSKNKNKVILSVN